MEGSHVTHGVGAAPTLEAISDVTTETGAVPLALAQILAVGVLTAAAVVLRPEGFTVYIYTLIMCGPDLAHGPQAGHAGSLCQWLQHRLTHTQDIYRGHPPWTVLNTRAGSGAKPEMNFRVLKCSVI